VQIALAVSDGKWSDRLFVNLPLEQTWDMLHM